jgi:RNA polymerase sigma-70 factor, ECF subfamily
MSLVDAFVAALPDGDAAAARTDPELAQALTEAIARGAEAHPDLPVAGAIVARHLGIHADEHRAPSEWLPTRNLRDVHLVCAILQGESAAIARFEERIVPELRIAATRLLKDDDLADEIIAGVREKLLVKLDARGPRIADYGGHGELVVWARVIAIRDALTQLRRRQRLVPADDHLWELASPTVDPALALLKQQSAHLIKAAFHAGLAALSPRQRNLLRQHLIDGLSIDELGAIYQIHRVTAARWLSAARADLWAHTRRQLRQTLGLSDSAIGTMLDEIRSTLDLSIERALAK